MKKLLTTLFIIAMIFAVAPSVTALENANLAATLLQYDPVPAEPGQFVTVYVQLENNGGDEAQNVAIEMVEQFPFSAVGADDLREEIGTLGAQRTFVKEFDVRVDSAAVVGNNKFKVKYSSTGPGGTERESEFNINIKSNEAALTVSNVKLDPEEITPGESGDVVLTIKNAADIALRTIAVQLDMQETLGTTVTDLPFIPQESTTEKRVGRLNPGQSTQLTFPIKAYPDASPGFYKLPLTMTYFDDAGTQQTTEDVIGVIVRAVPELKVIVDDTSISGVDQQGTVTLQFINKGINDLKFLDTELVSGEGYEVIGNGQDYIGDLDSDDYRSVTYTIKATGENPVLSVATDYKDENNENYMATQEVPLQFTTGAAEQQQGASGIVIVVIVVAIIGYVLYKRHKKKSRRKKK